MQIFLDANPQYWRFVPMLVEESQRPEQQSIQNSHLTDELDWNQRSKTDCFICVEAVPKPPTAYTFSTRQLLLQTQYFHKKRDLTLPNVDIDLYHATIVAICKFILLIPYANICLHSTSRLVPEACSEMFREIIESLFITHAQTTLNTIGNVLTADQQKHSYPLNNPWLVRGDIWCQGLLRRPQPKKQPIKETAT